jgi:hypothetical protein
MEEFVGTVQRHPHDDHHFGVADRVHALVRHVLLLLSVLRKVRGQVAALRQETRPLQEVRPRYRPHRVRDDAAVSIFRTGLLLREQVMQPTIHLRFFFKLITVSCEK